VCCPTSSCFLNALLHILDFFYLIKCNLFGALAGLHCLSALQLFYDLLTVCYYNRPVLWQLLMLYVMAVIAGERIDVVFWTAAFIQPRHGYKYWHVEGVCFLRVLGPACHRSGLHHSVVCLPVTGCVFVTFILCECQLSCSL